MPSASSIASRINREGEPVILRRTGFIDLALNAVVAGYNARDLVENIIQGDRQVILSDKEISDAGWPSPPRQGDRIMIRDKTTTIQSCETRMFRGQVVMHVAQVRG